MSGWTNAADAVKAEIAAVELLTSLEAEQAVLGAVMMDANAILKCAALTPDKFYQIQHRIIFRAMLDLEAVNEPIDVVTVLELLDKRGEAENAGGLSYLAELYQNTPSAANVGKYVRIVNDRYIERELLAASAEIEKIALGRNGETVTDKLNAAMSCLGNAAKDAVKRESKTFAETVSDLLVDLTNRCDGVRFGLPTGLPQLDEMTGGLPDGNLIVVAARPSMGKTVLAENMARFAAKQGKAVHFQSYEMSALEMARRGAAAEGGIEMQNLKTGRLTDKDLTALADYSAASKNWRLDVNCDLLSVEELCLMAKEKHMTGGLDLLVVDHLHIMPRPGRQNEVNELGDISRRLKNLAVELNIPVVLVAQLNRGNVKANDKRPSMSDIRGSGSVEQDANIIIMPHRESYYRQDENPNIAELIVAKNRDGEMGTVMCGWEGRHMRFTEDIDYSWRKPENNGDGYGYGWGDAYSV